MRFLIKIYDLYKLLCQLAIVNNFFQPKARLENGWNSKWMITQGEAAIPLETTRRAFGNQGKSKQRSAIEFFCCSKYLTSRPLTRVSDLHLKPILWILLFRRNTWETRLKNIFEELLHQTYIHIRKDCSKTILIKEELKLLLLNTKI